MSPLEIIATAIVLFALVAIRRTLVEIRDELRRRPAQAISNDPNVR